MATALFKEQFFPQRRWVNRNTAPIRLLTLVWCSDLPIGVVGRIVLGKARKPIELVEDVGVGVCVYAYVCICVGGGGGACGGRH